MLKHLHSDFLPLWSAGEAVRLDWSFQDPGNRNSVPHSGVMLFRHLYSWSLARATRSGVASRESLGLYISCRPLSHPVISSFKWGPPFYIYLFICLFPSNYKGLCFEFPTPSSRIGSYKDGNTMTLIMTYVYVVLFATLDAAFHLL